MYFYHIAHVPSPRPQVCRRIDRAVIRVANKYTQNTNVEIGERSGFRLFRHGVTEYLRKKRRVDGGWYISILRHLHVALCTTTKFFDPVQRAQVAAACSLCIKVHCSLRLPLPKKDVDAYQEDINRLLALTVDICAPSTPSGCASIKFHWPRHWAETRVQLGCSAHEKSLERKLGETHKKNYAYTNKKKDEKEVRPTKSTSVKYIFVVIPKKYISYVLFYLTLVLVLCRPKWTVRITA
jgi:hypothetical protein